MHPLLHFPYLKITYTNPAEHYFYKHKKALTKNMLYYTKRVRGGVFHETKI